MILHEQQNKQILQELTQNLLQLNRNEQLNWERKNTIQLQSKTQLGEINFYAHKTFSIKGWSITPGYFDIETQGLKLNMYISEFNELKDLADELIITYLNDLQEDNHEATKKLLNFSKSFSIESFRDNRIEKLLE